MRNLLCIALACASVSAVVACNVPVFRYALERWKPDATEVVVFYETKLAQLQASELKRLDSQAIGQGGHANAKLIRVNVASQVTPPEYKELWSELLQQEGVALPYVLVRTRSGQGQWLNHWHGRLSELEKFGLCDSPARMEIGQRLLAGHSVVWLLLKSSDPSKNDTARELVTQNFESLASKIKLPEGIGLPGSELYADVPLVMKFSLLEIDPDDKREAFLVGLLSGVRRQAFDDGEPLLVPVFGRGRALEVIPTSEMNAKLMEDLTIFLSGPCSCQVKERNPGFDLLINADWDGELFGDAASLPPDRSAEEGNNRKLEPLQIPPGRRQRPPVEPSKRQ